MALTLGIQLASSQTNNYLTDAKYVRGGYLIVEDVTAIDERWYDTGDGGVIVEGSLCYDLATEKLYKYTGEGFGEGWEELKFSTDADGKSITLNSDGELSIYGFSTATNNQVPAFDAATGKIKWTDVSGIIPGAVVPVGDTETINVTQDTEDPDKYIVSLLGKEAAVDKSVLRKHITEGIVTYTWDEIYSASEVDDLIEDAVDNLYETSEGSVTINKSEVEASKVTSVGSQAVFTEGAFTANVPTAIDTSKFSGGSQASFTQGSKASLTTSEISYVAEGVTVSIPDQTGLDEDDDDFECLVFTNVVAQTAKAVDEFTANGDDSFTANTVASLSEGFYTAGTAASKAADSFTTNALPTFDTVAADKVTDATFTGTETKVYQK